MGYSNQGHAGRQPTLSGASPRALEDERLSYFEGDYAPTEIHEERAKQAAAEFSGETDVKAEET